MRNSDFHRLAAVLLAAVPAASCADEIALSGDARLSGVVRSISAKGVVELASPLAAEPILLKPGAVRRVTFGTPEAAALPGTLIELANGDLLPATLESLDAAALTVATPEAGRLVIPRGALKSMQLGVRKKEAIYSGPVSAKEWAREDASENHREWRFDHGALVASGPAVGSRKFDTPLQFVLRFTLTWQGNPNYQVYFADPLEQSGAASDRYLFQFNLSGMEIRRESTTGRRSQTVLLIPRPPDQFPNRKVAVEIRVDRKSSRLHVLLNGEPEGAGVDPVQNPPAGGGIVLMNSAPAGLTQEIGSIELLEFDNSAARHRSERRGDLKADSLISREEDRWSGNLTEIRPGADGAVFVFSTVFQDQPLELPEADVSTVFFARPEDSKEAAAAAPGQLLRLPGNGSLHVLDCVLGETGIVATHPLLGRLEIARGGVIAIETTAAVKGDELKEPAAE